MKPDFQLYDKTLQVSSWADLFGFQMEAGKDGDEAFVVVDGKRYASTDPNHVLAVAAMAMGMSEERINGNG